ncbi:MULTISPECIES: hypothetical protein [Yersinia]|uniref:hypothetical protein n=1 Tax=Yersinia TaxID=629 RepID=UPI00110D6EFE|nr:MULTISPECIES: hypothetical protein [Yersinia]QDW31674.1 hypothetical protein FFE93_000450 [Yersinia sp. KBS0713]
MKLIYALLVTAIIYSINLLAAPPPYVYRFDTRSPSSSDYIFANGFTAYGDNDNIIQHVTGESVGGVTGSGKSKNSAFIPTSDDFSIARIFAGMTFGATKSIQGKTAWIYKIKTDEAFYYVPATLQNIIDKGYYKNSNDSIVSIEELIKVYESEREWVAVKHIKSTQIISAFRVTYSPDTHTTTIGSEEKNPYHVESSRTPISPFTYHPGDTTLNAIYIYTNIKMTPDQCIIENTQTENLSVSQEQLQTPCGPLKKYSPANYAAMITNVKAIIPITTNLLLN